MSSARVLALWAADDVERGVLVEFVRIATAAVAAGLALDLLDLRPPGGRRAALPDGAQRLLDALAGAGVRPRAVDAAGLRSALGASGSMLRLASPRRPSAPPRLLVTDEWISSTPDAELLRALVEAGQVVRAGRV